MVFAATLKPVVPEPVPLAPLVTVTHDTPLTDVQPHPDVVVTATEPVPPDAATDWLVGEIVKAQTVVPLCVTVKVEPAMVRVPVRLVVPVFAATLKPAVPGPTTEAPEVTVIHEALLTEVHAHPEATVTVLLLEPAVAAADQLAGEMEGVHGAVYETVLDRAESALPPGPTAETITS